jgi:hypothetical protein
LCGKRCERGSRECDQGYGGDEDTFQSLHAGLLVNYRQRARMGATTLRMIFITPRPSRPRQRLVAPTPVSASLYSVVGTRLR